MKPGYVYKTTPELRAAIKARIDEGIADQREPMSARLPIEGAIKALQVKRYPGAADVLWDLLSERTPEQSVSHTVSGMPTREQHEAWVAKPPYRMWWILLVDGVAVGAMYLTYGNEIGIGILRAHQRKGYARTAVNMMVQKWGNSLRKNRLNPRLPKREFYAHINPANAASIALFESMGFSMRQVTYVKQVDLVETPDAGLRVARPAIELGPTLE